MTDITESTEREQALRGPDYITPEVYRLNIALILKICLVFYFSGTTTAIAVTETDPIYH